MLPGGWLLNVEVDQSWKIEQTNRATALALADGIEYAVLVPSGAKKEAISRLRATGKSGRRIYLYLFAVAVYQLLKEHLDLLSAVVIDCEYEGREHDVRLVLLNLIWKSHPGFPAEAIAFGHIGKTSRAHKRALAVFRNEIGADRILTAEDLLDPK